ncbi:MAG: hypothetical protein ACI8SE_000762 [Bacteroidia bacterium]|jgi:hypothetical protein
MKTTFTLLTVLTLSIFGIDTQAGVSSKLHLNLFNDGQFVVVVDGIRYADVGGTLAVSNLNAGTHRIKIVEIFGNRSQGRGQGQSQAGRQVLYNGSVNIPFRSAVFARLTDNYNLRVTEVKRLNPPVRRQPVYRDQNRRNRSTYGNRGGYGHNRFMSTKQQMRRAAFDRNKLAIAKQFIRSSRATSAEVSQLMNLLAFDRTKLELAKFSYGFVIDKHNFRQVRRSLTFDDSLRQLDRFIAHQNPQQRTRRR